MKIIINDTVSLTPEVRENWLNWMKAIVFPLAQKSQLLESCRLTQIRNEGGEENSSFAVQYICSNSDTYSEFINNFDPKIQQEQNNRFRGHFGAFRTVLEVLEEFDQTKN